MERKEEIRLIQRVPMGIPHARAAMHNIILGDSQAIFRAGTAKVLAMEEDFRIIAQCADLENLERAMRTTQASIVLVATALKPDFEWVFATANRTGSRIVVIAESGDTASDFTSFGASGIVYRNISGPELVECMRRILNGEVWMQATAATLETAEEDLVGQRVRDRLTPKELKIVALIVHGCKNKEIAMRLGTTEQVIKNYLRSIYDKTGVSDRLELALFTIHHRILSEAAEKAVGGLQMLQDVRG
jgi:DNA-binding NarL/FixJ family response regulator